jgi:hypothetical protein
MSVNPVLFYDELIGSLKGF